MTQSLDRGLYSTVVLCGEIHFFTLIFKNMQKAFWVMMTFSIPLFFAACEAQSCCGNGKTKQQSETSAVCTTCGKNTCDQTCSANLTSSDKPIPSCSLDADAQTKRGEEVIYKTFNKATTIRELPDGYDVVFVHSPEIVAELNEIAAFERTCCASFKWEVSEDLSQKQVHLTVFGSPAVKKELKPGFERFGLAHLMQQ